MINAANPSKADCKQCSVKVPRTTVFSSIPDKKLDKTWY